MEFFEAAHYFEVIWHIFEAARIILRLYGIFLKQHVLFLGYTAYF